MSNSILKKRQRHTSTLQMLIDRQAFGPRVSREAMIMIAAAKRYYSIMTAGTESTSLTGTPNSKVDSSLNPARFDAAIVRSIDQRKEINDLRKGLSPYFSTVLDFILVDDLTTKETAERLFSKADSKTETLTLERLRGALMHVAASKFHLLSE
ncbi:hypothetical protein [Bradyrhizobium sp. BR 1432]|uniref:hypothetical protein n=1 Tax=Bradyrhizobium sp. BR 1432 TaxID=3447966 RepID=UPI003EE52376